MKNVFLVFIGILFSLKVFSNDTLDFKTVDKKTYDYYMSRQWDSLIDLGNYAIENNIDYFYLRARLGAAYYEKKNFEKAAIHFEKALGFNASDSYSIESLYNCYIFLNRQSDAHNILKQNPRVFEGKTNKGFLKEVFIDMGINSTQNNTNPFIEKHPPEVQWAESNKTNQIFFGSAGINYSLGKNILVTNSYSHLQIGNTRQIFIGPELLNDNYTLYQNQIYTNFSYRLSKGTVLTPAFHYLSVDYKTLSSDYDTIIHKVILNRTSVTFNDYAASLTLDHKFLYYGINLFGTFSSLNNSRQKQLGLIFSIFPKGNLNLYSLSTFVLQKSGKNSEFIFEEAIGIKIFNHLWVEGFITPVGHLENYVEQSAYIVYNIADIIKRRAGVSFTIPLNKLKIVFRYQFLDKVSSFSFYNNSKRIGHFDHQENFLTGTISWKF